MGRKIASSWTRRRGLLVTSMLVMLAAFQCHPTCVMSFLAMLMDRFEFFFSFLFLEISPSLPSSLLIRLLLIVLDVGMGSLSCGKDASCAQGSAHRLGLASYRAFTCIHSRMGRKDFALGLREDGRVAVCSSECSWDEIESHWSTFFFRLQGFHTLWRTDAEVYRARREALIIVSEDAFGS